MSRKKIYDDNGEWKIRTHKHRHTVRNQIDVHLKSDKQFNSFFFLQQKKILFLVCYF